MANETIINPALTQETQLNIELGPIEAYDLENRGRPSGVQPTAGTVLLERYRVTERMDVASGEADLFRCTDGETQYVAKLYRRESAVGTEVLESLRQLTTPYVVRPHAIGVYEGRTVEILPYYRNGTIQGSLYSEDELIRTVIPCVNEGLHAMHEAGILHRDLKPANLVLSNDETRVEIIDFGISSAVDPDSMVHIAHMGLTPEYSAPETFKGVFCPESDYYSLGITLFELLLGYAPYANSSAEEIAQYTLLQRVELPDTISDRMKDLITGLTYADITNRAEKANPNRRWTYDEVRRWLNGELLPLPGQSVISGGMLATPCEFLGEHYTDISSLVKALAMHWEEGKRFVFHGSLRSYLRPLDRERAAQCLAAEEEAGRENGKDDAIFRRLLYRLDPSLKGLYWRGRCYESLPALGRRLLEQLWDEDMSECEQYTSILSARVLTGYTMHIAPGNEKLRQATTALEELYDEVAAEQSSMRALLFRMGYTLSGQRIYRLDGESFTTVGEFAEYMKQLLATDRKGFTELCHRLMTYQGTIRDEQLEVWLCCLGKESALSEWRRLMEI